MWASIFDLSRIVATNDGEYARLLQKGSSGPSIRQIQMDLRRTFPESPDFNPDSVVGLCSLERLERVLTAFSLRNPAIGYSQGFNFIAAVLLTQFQEEELAFWSFVTVVEEMLPIGFYDESLSGCQGCLKVLQVVLRPLVHRRVPKSTGARYATSPTAPKECAALRVSPTMLNVNG